MSVMFDFKSNKNRVAQQRHGFLRFLALNEPLPKPTPKRNQSAGFTLLELLVVIGLLGVVAIASMTIIIDTKDIESLDATEKRWNQIRYAIIGDTSRTLNNEPMVSGYVADMGRLPANIQELFIQGDQPDWAEYDLYTADTGYSAKYGGGWRGPYLYTAGSANFRDGWGNVDSLNRDEDADGSVADEADDDATNFGWVLTYLPAGCLATFICEEISVASFGDDNQNDGITAADEAALASFNEDFPSPAQNIVFINDWLNQVTSLTFNIYFNEPISSTSSFYLKIYYFSDDGNVLTAPAISSQTSAPFNVVSGAQSASVSISPSEDLPQGKYAAVIYCNAASTEVFDTDVATCDATNKANPFFFNFLPNMSSISVHWNLY